jgi:hypothetical protein
MKSLLAFFIGLTAVTTSFGQVAPDFTANDCNGTSHNLYSELNTGKVIVLCWVMPCSACIGPSLTAYNIVQSYASPDVAFYLLDDFGNTSCTTVNGWANANNIGLNRTTFSTAAIIETNYGGTGMPHVVVVGPDHNIYFNGLNAAAGNSTAIQNAINTALTATGIKENNELSAVNIIQGESKITVDFTTRKAATVNIELINETGQLIFKNPALFLAAGSHLIEIPATNLSGGIYFLRLNADKSSRVMKFTFK